MIFCDVGDGDGDECVEVGVRCEDVDKGGVTDDSLGEEDV